MAILLDGTLGITTPDLTDTSLTSGRVVYAGTGGNLTGSTNLVFDGAILGVNGVSVGRGAGAIASNTALGADALAQNSTGAFSTVVGREAGFSTLTSSYNTFLGYRAGYSTTGDQNTFLGKFAGNAITSGATNTIVGAYNGNQASLDIRTASNYTVISDGGGTPHLAAYAGGTVALQGAVPVAGTGITFPATQSASSNANTLDDYEEGTFTPRIDGLTTAGTGTYTTQTGRYVKIGKMVTLWFYIDWSNHTGTGSIQFANFPFTAQNSIAMPCSASISNIALSVNNYSSTAAVQPNATYAFPLQYPLGGGAAALIPMDTSANIYCTATYEVA